MMSIGLEIEVNKNTNDLSAEVAESGIWSIVDEHCGIELKLKEPATRPAEILKVMRFLQSVESNDSAHGIGFLNAGTHIHFGFLSNKKMPIKKAAEWIKTTEDGYNIYRHPFDKYSKYYWVDENGNQFHTLSQWRGVNNLNKDEVYIKTPPDILEDVKRFLLLSVRFAMPLIILQHPDRRVNKYCHTLADWPEDKLMACKSVAEIDNHVQLGNLQRRLMVNPQSFKKWGTLEVRLIKASLTPIEVWSQIFLWGKMVKLAKSRAKIPVTSNDSKYSTDFNILLDACKIHGRVRNLLIDQYLKNAKTIPFSVHCFNYHSCNNYGPAHTFVDYGNSRLLCKQCHGSRHYCAVCGQQYSRSSSYNYGRIVDEKIAGGRFVCNHCMGALTSEGPGGYLWSMGMKVGNGFDEWGFIGLRRMLGVFQAK